MYSSETILNMPNLTNEPNLHAVKSRLPYFGLGSSRPLLRTSAIRICVPKNPRPLRFRRLPFTIIPPPYRQHKPNLREAEAIDYPIGILQ